MCFLAILPVFLPFSRLKNLSVLFHMVREYSINLFTFSVLKEATLGIVVVRAQEQSRSDIDESPALSSDT